MRERYSGELKWHEKILGIWRINRDSIDTKWGYFAPRFGLEFVINRGGYFDPQYSITFAFIWGAFNIKLPFRTSLGEGCSLPRYGFLWHENSIMFYTGGYYDKSWGQVTRGGCHVWDLPFISYVFEHHLVRSTTGEMIPYEYELQDTAKHTYPYTYTLKSGEVQERLATCYEEVRQWHRKWLPFLKMRRRTINIEFDGEVGERSGSWKGGTIGCSYDILDNETIEDCLSRMSKEREFN